MRKTYIKTKSSIKFALFSLLFVLISSCATTNYNDEEYVTIRLLNDKGQVTGYVQGSKILDTKGQVRGYIRK